MLAKLAALTGNSDAAEAALASMRAEMAQAPFGFASWLSALDFVLSDPSELAIVGANAPPMLHLVRSTYRLNLAVAAASRKVSGDDASSVPLIADPPAIDGATTAYLCRHFAFERPVTAVEDLAVLLLAKA